MGMLAAMLEASRSGKGQVVDAAIVDGAASMMTMFYGMLAGGMWKDERQSNLLDGGAPFFRNYETKDKKYVAVCALERRFFKALLDTLGVNGVDPADQYDTEKWPIHQKIFEDLFRTKSRDEWSAVLEGTDACFAPILSLREAPTHPHNQERKTFVTVDGVLQPGPAPRFSRTESEIQNVPNEPGEFNRQALADWGLSEAEIARLL
jgi:alpha-methylacyl-CoA racemase